MFVQTVNLRVRYAETDQMGVVYYGNYPQYLEVGRVECLRKLGITYREIEESGIMMPVLNLEIKYIRPATYDELLNIETEIREMPQSRIKFHHRITNEKEQLLTTAMVELVFVDAQSRRPTRAPSLLTRALNPFFPKEA